MLRRFKAWLKSRSATTPCAVLPGDIVRVRITSDIDRPCIHNGVILGMFEHHNYYEFEWEATRPFRTMDDAILACSATIDIIHVQGSKYV